MEVGQVAFKDARKVKRILVPARENPIVNRLNKTKVEKKPDLQQERDDRLKELRSREQLAQLARVRYLLFSSVSPLSLPLPPLSPIFSSVPIQPFPSPSPRCKERRTSGWMDGSACEYG